jgi:hypothetical protein
LWLLGIILLPSSYIFPVITAASHFESIFLLRSRLQSEFLSLNEHLNQRTVQFTGCPNEMEVALLLLVDYLHGRNVTSPQQFGSGFWFSVDLSTVCK